MKNLRRWWTKEVGGTIEPAPGKNPHDRWVTPKGAIAASTNTSGSRGKSDPNYERMIRGQLRRALRAEGNAHGVS